MKIAITGKGGVGKTTFSAALIQLLARNGQKVIALDADPNANLAAALGLSDEIQKTIVPISQQNKLIEERTGAKIKQYGQVFKLNPEVSDVVDKYATVYENVALLVLGGLEKGGTGCACPENTFIRALITDLVLFKQETLILDMEAGVEHLGRATIKGVDMIIIVLEPSNRSISTATRIREMAADIGLTNLKVVGNKIMNPQDEAFIQDAFPDLELLGLVPNSPAIRENDRNKRPAIENLEPATLKAYENIMAKIIQYSSKK